MRTHTVPPPEELPKLTAVQKSRDALDKTQEDYLRLFKQGTQDEAKHVVIFLDLENLISLMKNKFSSLSKRISENRAGILNTFCLLDNGANYKLAISFHGESYHQSLPTSYLFKASEHGATSEEIMKFLDNNQEILPMPDAFFDKHIKPLELSKQLQVSRQVTDAVFLRMTNVEIINVIKRMAGCEGIYLLLGLEVSKEDTQKLRVNLSEETVLKFPSCIYPEIKDDILEVDASKFFSQMVIENSDKVMAEKMIIEKSGHHVPLLGMFKFKEKLSIFKKRLLRNSGRGTMSAGHYSVMEIFSPEELPIVFESLLNLKDSYGEECLKHMWEKVRYGEEKLKKSFLEILEKTSSSYAPIDSNMPKRVRLNLLKNGISAGPGHVRDFTRKELFERFDGIWAIKSLAPHKLTSKELIRIAESESGNVRKGEVSFLKSNLALYPVEFLKKKFKDVQVLKDFIGNRTRRENRIAYSIISTKCGLTY